MAGERIFLKLLADEQGCGVGSNCVPRGVCGAACCLLACISGAARNSAGYIGMVLNVKELFKSSRGGMAIRSFGTIAATERTLDPWAARPLQRVGMCFGFCGAFVVAMSGIAR